MIKLAPKKIIAWLALTTLLASIYYYLSIEYFIAAAVFSSIGYFLIKIYAENREYKNMCSQLSRSINNLEK